MTSELKTTSSKFIEKPGIEIYYNNDLHRFGNVVCYSFQTLPISISSGDVIATVPTGFRPVTTTIGIVRQDGDEIILYNINPDGNMIIYGSINNHMIGISGAYISSE